jgi:hypothetical protein
VSWEPFARPSTNPVHDAIVMDSGRRVSSGRERRSASFCSSRGFNGLRGGCSVMCCGMGRVGRECCSGSIAGSGGIVGGVSRGVSSDFDCFHHMLTV